MGDITPQRNIVDRQDHPADETSPRRTHFEQPGGEGKIDWPVGGDGPPDIQQVPRHAHVGTEAEAEEKTPRPEGAGRQEGEEEADSPTSADDIESDPSEAGDPRAGWRRVDDAPRSTALRRNNSQQMARLSAAAAAVEAAAAAVAAIPAVGLALLFSLLKQSGRE